MRWHRVPLAVIPWHWVEELPDGADVFVLLSFRGESSTGADTGRLAGRVVTLMSVTG